MITSPVGDDAKPWLLRFLGGPGTFTLGAVTTGALVGVTLQSLGGLPPVSVLRGAALLAAAALLLRPVLFDSLRPPSGRWLVPRGWSRFGRPGYSFLFGAALGTGFATPVTTGTVYLVALLVATAETPVPAAGIFGVFGLARAVPLMVVGRCMSRRALRTRDCLAWLGWSRPVPDLGGRIVTSFLVGVVVQYWNLAPFE